MVFIGNYCVSRFCISRLIISLSEPPDVVSVLVVMAAAPLVEVEAGVAA
jgi:hypothetical protein